MPDLGNYYDGREQNTEGTLYFLIEKCKDTSVVKQRAIRMDAAYQHAHEVLLHDVNPEFIQTFSIAIAWEYHTLYEELAADRILPPELKSAEFASRRGGCAIKALVFAAKQHGIPFSIKRLSCNGQSKILVKMGRVVLIQEPMDELSGHPKAALYKTQLAEAYGLTRQLELDLGDQPNRVLDWSGELLAVLLHGSSGPSFTRREKMLGGLMMAVPDDEYLSWILRLDLRRIAIWGNSGGNVVRPKPALTTSQPDEVQITLKAKNVRVGKVK